MTKKRSQTKPQKRKIDSDNVDVEDEIADKVRKKKVKVSMESVKMPWIYTAI